MQDWPPAKLHAQVGVSRLAFGRHGTRVFQDFRLKGQEKSAELLSYRGFPYYSISVIND